VNPIFNIYDLPSGIDREEVSQSLLISGGVRIERIVSVGQTSPQGFWYDQDKKEWVTLLQGQARLAWGDGRQQELSAGDCLLIQAHEKHRVEYTSQEPPCIWLAVHFE